MTRLAAWPEATRSDTRLGPAGLTSVSGEWPGRYQSLVHSHTLPIISSRPVSTSGTPVAVRGGILVAEIVRLNQDDVGLVANAWAGAGAEIVIRSSNGQRRIRAPPIGDFASTSAVFRGTSGQ